MTTAAAPAPSAVPSTPFASASLYVGDLQPDVTEALLFEIFNAVGPVQSVRVCRDAATRRSLGYAYVNFHRVDDAERALDTMNFKNIRGRPCRIMWSHRDPSLRKSGLGNIFVKNLAKTIDNKQLYDTFSMFGNILSCKVCTNDKRESLGYGFVHYETDEAAQQAIQRVDGKVIAGEKVSVQTFKGKKERGGSDKFKYTNIFVKNLPAETTGESLQKFFEKYGTVTSSVVNVDKDDSTRAFGFVNMSTPEEATAAVEGANDQEFEGRKIYVGRAQKKEEREKELRERFEALKMERQKKYVGVNLYVKNLSDDFDDAKLSNEFAKFGQITSAKIMRDPAGKSRGFGFVCFSTPEEATKAVTELNGRMIDSKPLYVALAQRKDARRAQLEAQYAARAKMGGVGLNGFGGMPQGAFNPAAMQAAAMYAPGQMMQFPGGVPPARGFMYGQQPPMPGMMVPQQGFNPRFNPQQQQRAPQGQPMNYNMMQQMPGGRGPMPMQGAGPQGQMRQGPGQQRPVQQRPGMNGPQGGKPPMMQQQQQRFPAGAGRPGAAPTAEQVVMPLPSEPLTIKALAAAPEDMRKQMIGERLFPLIKMQEPQLAGKITGMLLEMDNGELIHLLESHQALHEKIQEALQVLQQHPGSLEGEQATEEAEKQQ